MSKPKEPAYITNFLKIVWPEYTELSVIANSEEETIIEATRIIQTANNKIKELQEEKKQLIDLGWDEVTKIKEYFRYKKENTELKAKLEPLEGIDVVEFMKEAKALIHQSGLREHARDSDFWERQVRFTTLFPETKKESEE